MFAAVAVFFFLVNVVRNKTKFCISLKKILAKKYYKKLQKYVSQFKRNFMAKI